MKIFKKVQGFGGKPSLTYEDCRWCFPRLSWPIWMKSGRPQFVVGFHWENPPGFNQTSGLSGWYQNLNRSQVSHDYLHIFIFISNHRNIHGSSDLIMKWHAVWKHWGLYWIDPHHHQHMADLNQVSHSLKEALKADRSHWNQRLPLKISTWIIGSEAFPGGLEI